MERVVQDYLSHLSVERGLADNTIRSYRRDLRRYVDFLSAEGLTEPAEITENDIAAFLGSLRTGDDEHSALGTASAARTIVSARGLHRFMVREQLVTADVTAAVKPPRPAARLPKALPLERHRGDPRGCRSAGHDAVVARSCTARGAVRHGCSHLRSGRHRSRRPGPRGLDRPAARQGWQAADPPGRVVRPRVPDRLPDLVTPGAGVGAAKLAGGVPQRPRWPPVATERVDRAHQGRQACGHHRQTSPRTRCGTRSRRICWTGEPTYAWCRSCSDMPL